MTRCSQVIWTGTRSTACMRPTVRFAARYGEAVAQGARVVPATGRSLLPAGEHGFTGLNIDAVCANGSIIRGRNGELLKTFTVDPAFVEELIRSFPQICFDCCTPDGMFSSGSFEMHRRGSPRQPVSPHRDARYARTWRGARGAVLRSIAQLDPLPRCLQDQLPCDERRPRA